MRRAAEQFYVTHCAPADSVLNHPGYTVRAASADAPALLDAAFHYPPYELPFEMWRGPVPAALAPRRLARTRHPKGGVWAVHSAHLEKDTVGRDRSYFSHLLLLPDAEPAEVLRSWASEEWATGYPPGAPKKLPGGAALPAGELVTDAALTAFLNDDPDGPTELGVAVCPERLRDSTARRRELLADMLRAVLLFAEAEDDARRRLYVHAEPGLVALLLYGAVRLLPAAATDDLTFSTFEPPHRNLREYRLAEVVGTYTGRPDRGLDPDLGTARGFVLDTFAPHRSSPELRTGGWPDGLAALLELAAAGEWELLPEVRRALGPDPSALSNAGAALVRARGLARVDAGTAALDDLLALQADPAGAEALKARADRVWPAVRDAVLARPDVRDAFRDLIARPEHARELWDDAFAALLRDAFDRWAAGWDALRLGAGPDEARRLLDKLVNRERHEAKLLRLSAGVRERLRRACADVGLFPPRPLLVPADAAEAEALLAAQPDWAGFAAFVLLADDDWGWLAHIPPDERGPARDRARDLLHTGPPEVVAAYLRAARPLRDTAPHLITNPFTSYSAEAAGLVRRLLAARALDPADWVALCEVVPLVQGEWGDFLLQETHLADLLVCLGGDGVGRGVWAGYLDLLTPALLSPAVAAGDGDPQAVHAWERAVHGHLRTAAERLTAAGVRLVQALPPGGVAKLFAANELVSWADDPRALPADASDDAPRACDAFGIERLALVRAVYGALGRPTAGTGLNPVVELFRACFPADGTFNTARRVASEAVRLSADAPPAARGDLQAHLIAACVPDANFAALVNDADRPPALDPAAVGRLREALDPPANGPAFTDAEPHGAVIVRRPRAGRAGCLGAVLFAAAVGGAVVAWVA